MATLEVNFLDGQLDFLNRKAPALRMTLEQFLLYLIDRHLRT
jgi:hypothetical protein